MGRSIWSDENILLLRRVAARREAIHKGHDTSRPLSKDYEFIGLTGEWIFGRTYDYPIDLSDRPKGDGKVDFYTAAGTVDVKTARSALNLFREVGVECAEILVLAAFSDETQHATLLGWEWSAELLKCPQRVFKEGGPPNYYKLRGSLRPMKEFAALDAAARVKLGRAVAAEPDPLWEALPTHLDAPPPAKRSKPVQLGFDLTELDAPAEPAAGPNPYGAHS